MRSIWWRSLFLYCFVLSMAAFEAALAENGTQINLPREIGERIGRCWTPPEMVPPQVLEVTVRLSFSRTGSVIGEPRITYIRVPDQAGFRDKIKASVFAAIKACSPLPFTPALGAAIAGRMFAIRFRSLPVTGRRVI